jgi:hypothetical protein
MFSWLINMFIGTLPMWVWPAGAGAAAVIYFLSGILAHIPNTKVYAFLLKPVSFIALLVCVFMYGGSGVAEVYQEELKIADAKVTTAQEAAKIANNQVKTVIVEKVKTIHDTKVVVRKEIQQVEKKIDADCHIDPEAINILNQAAHNGDTK